MLIENGVAGAAGSLVQLRLRTARCVTYHSDVGEIVLITLHVEESRAIMILVQRAPIDEWTKASMTTSSDAPLDELILSVAKPSWQKVANGPRKGAASFREQGL